MRKGTCIDMYIDMCRGRCKDVGADMCTDMCTVVCIDMCTVVCLDVCTDMCQGGPGNNGLTVLLIERSFGGVTTRRMKTQVLAHTCIDM